MKRFSLMALTIWMVRWEVNLGAKDVMLWRSFKDGDRAMAFAQRTARVPWHHHIFLEEIHT